MAAYVVVDIEVTDPVAFEEYRQGVPATVAQYGGRFIVRGGKSETLEGGWDPKRLVVLEFPSTAAVKRWYYRYRIAILSFCLGTLLNMYTLFFFKSSSLLVSFSFLLVMVALLLLNEFGPFQRLGLSFKFALLSLSVCPSARRSCR